MGSIIPIKPPESMQPTARSLEVVERREHLRVALVREEGGGREERERRALHLSRLESVVFAVSAKGKLP